MHWHFSGVISLYFRDFNALRHLFWQVLKIRKTLFILAEVFLLMDLPPANNMFVLLAQLDPSNSNSVILNSPLF